MRRCSAKRRTGDATWSTPPANDLCPGGFADVAAATGRRFGAAVDVLDEPALRAGGFGGILGVGQGSARPPRLVRITHTHPAARSSLALVGKGITYDSGGISLKPFGDNEIVNTTCPARRPCSRCRRWHAGVLRMYDGRTGEVLNTDAVGRLVLADALVRLAEHLAGENRHDS